MSNINEVINKTMKNSNLKIEEKELLSLLEKDPYLYLENYGSFLTEFEFNFFLKNHSDNYEVNWYLNKKMKPSINRKTIQNRRFNAINKLANSEYFSLEEMKQRRPELYSQIMGKYYKQQVDDFDKNMKVYERILKNYDYSMYTNRILEDRKNDEEIVIEKDENEEKSDEDDENFDYFIQKNQKIIEKKSQNNQQINHQIYQLKIDDEEINLTLEESEDVKQQTEEEYLIQHFISEMKRMFIEGKDEEFFDYSTVDKDESLDDLNQLAMDEEEKYFDEE